MPGFLRANRCLLLVLLGCGLIAGCGGSGRSEEPNLPVVEVSIGHRMWKAEVAADPDTRYRGLSGREKLAFNRGMLFVFPEEDVRVFCMRGCAIDIDIAFINAEKRVVTIHEMKAEPLRLGEKGYSSEVPVKYALEVLGGELDRAGVEVGDRVEISGELPRAR